MPQAVSPSASPSLGRSTIRIGTRGSALALWQARHIRHVLTREFPLLAFEIRVIQSEGDLDKESPLTRIGGRGVFTSALQRALSEGTIDLAVHSTKDVPTLSPEGLAISAFTGREDPRDVLISRHGVGIDALPANPVVGTSSRRRAVQVRQLRPDAQVVDLRGNIDTRLRKAASGDYDAVILAAAGLIRMGWESRITEFLPVARFVPSPGQGVLAIETRAAPDPAVGIAASLADARVTVEVSAERAFLRSIGGGCTAPIGAHARVETTHGREIVRFWGMLGSEDGSRIERIYEEFAPEVAETAVAAIGQTLKRSIAPIFTGASPAEEAALDDRALDGMQVLVTGTTALAVPLVAHFGEQGATAHHVATISVERSADESLVEQAIADLRQGHYGWLIVTSGNAVDAIARLAPDAGEPWPVRVAAVGWRTADRLREIGFDVTIEPNDQRAEGLIAAMATQDVQGQRVLCLFGNRARGEIPEALRARGAEVDTIEAYRTVDATGIDPKIRGLVRAGVVNVVVFASPSSVQAMRHLLGTDLAALSGACLVAIGPTTAAAMRDVELPVHAIATHPGVSGVVEAVKRYVTGRGPCTPQRRP